MADTKIELETKQTEPPEQRIFRQTTVFVEEQFNADPMNLAVSHQKSSKQCLQQPAEEPLLENIMPIKQILISASQEKREPLEPTPGPFNVEENRI